MFCQKCGSQAIEDATFCRKCGEKLVSIEPSSPSENLPKTNMPSTDAPPEGKPEKSEVVIHGHSSKAITKTKVYCDNQYVGTVGRDESIVIPLSADSLIEFKCFFRKTSISVKAGKRSELKLDFNIGSGKLYVFDLHSPSCTEEMENLKRSNKKWALLPVVCTVLFIILRLISLLISGSGADSTAALNDISNQNSESIVMQEPVQEDSELIVVQEQVQENSENAFATIIDAYAKLEQSGYSSIEDIISDSLLAVQKDGTYNFGDSLPSLMYAFYDMNGNGLPELLIGVDGFDISGIYAVQDGKATSVIQVEDRYSISLLMASNGSCVIEHAWGHMGDAMENFYTIDDAGKLVIQDKLYTNWNNGTFRSKDTGGNKVSITEEEYCALIRKYGAEGYEPASDTGKVRAINLDWKPILGDIVYDAFNENTTSTENLYPGEILYKGISLSKFLGEPKQNWIETFGEPDWEHDWFLMYEDKFAPQFNSQEYPYEIYSIGNLYKPKK